MAREKKSQKQSRGSQLDAKKLDVQSLKAENSIVDHLEARSAFLSAAQGDEPGAESLSVSHESAGATQGQRKEMAVIAVRQQNAMQRSVRRSDPLSRFSETLEEVLDMSQRQALVLKNTHGVLQDLVQEWTTLDESSGAERLVPELQIGPMGESHDTIHESGSRGSLATPKGIRQGSAMTDTLPMPYKSSDLKHAESHDSRYRSSYSGHRHATASQPHLGQPSTPLGRMRSLHDTFETQWRPLVMDLTMHPPSDPLLRRKGYMKLSEGIMAQIMLKADDIDLEGNKDARGMKNYLISEANRVISELQSGSIASREGLKVHDSSDDDTSAQHSPTPDSDVGDALSTSKWESHHDKSNAYIAAGIAGTRLQGRPGDAYWIPPERSGNDNDNRLPPSRLQRRDAQMSPSAKAEYVDASARGRARSARHTAEWKGFLDRNGIKKHR